MGASPSVLVFRGVASFSAPGTALQHVYTRVSLDLTNSTLSVSFFSYQNGGQGIPPIALTFFGGAKGSSSSSTQLFLYSPGLQQVSQVWVDTLTLLNYFTTGELYFVAFFSSSPPVKGDLFRDQVFKSAPLLTVPLFFSGVSPAPEDSGRVILSVDYSLPSGFIFLSHPGLNGLADLTLAFLDEKGNSILTLLQGKFSSPVVAHLLTVPVEQYVSALSLAKYIGVLDSRNFNPLLIASAQTTTGEDVPFIGQLKSKFGKGAGTGMLSWNQATNHISWNVSFSSLSSPPLQISLWLKSSNLSIVTLQDIKNGNVTSGWISGEVFLGQGQMSGDMVVVGLANGDLSLVVTTGKYPLGMGEIEGSFSPKEFYPPEMVAMCRGVWWILNPNRYAIQFAYGRNKRFPSQWAFLNGGSASFFAVRGAKNLNLRLPSQVTFFNSARRKQVDCFHLHKNCNGNWTFTSSNFNSMQIAAPVQYSILLNSTTGATTSVYFYALPSTSFFETLSAFPGVNATTVSKIQLSFAGRVLQTTGNPSGKC